MRNSEILKIHELPALERASLVLAFTGWMNGGEVSIGTVQHLVNLLGGKPIAEIDPEPFCIYCAPGPMEVAAMYRPHVEVEEGLVKEIDLPTNTFYCCASLNLLLFIGQEPHLRWPTFGECIFQLAVPIERSSDRVRRIVWRRRAAHPAAASVHQLFRCKLAAGNGAVRCSPDGVPRTRRIHNVFNDAGQDRWAGDGFFGGRDSWLSARRQPGEH